MRQFCFVVLCSLFPSAIPEAAAQEVKSVSKQVAPREDAPPEAQLFEEGEKTLRAFRPPEESEVVKARSLIMGLLVGTFVAVIIMFLLIAYFYEPSEASKPYRPTSVQRPEGFTAWKPKQEAKTERIVIDEE